ncbi:protein DMP3-like [Phoenix dactylifera]|uniref:Protein DMP3-like n=1 Tax=Phoenix dactylifera TaxID=42345 RepID=A0A8B9A459_PHODC|nr:protein DMP3-like [Phoenix dactylifera]XP_038978778.1 protein DMP3-like [Phoenix dactylifera]XP_038978779.1 protein DMP3-like [Phoenix dactylifera]XP_038979279.1 protein DMP3-like [Phoenix dactylifera]XP_038981416.1 protein DMP3-like [Phoenix dactylifera]
MTEISSAITIANSQDSEPRELDRSTPLRGTTPSQSLTSQRRLVIDKTLSTAANLAQLLPTGSVLAFQALSPSIANQCICYASNKYITLSLLLICTISCIFFSFTDSFKGTNGKLYYGMATCKSFIVFNYQPSDGDRSKVLEDLLRFRIRWLDYVHAFFSVLLFLALTFSDTNIQNCFFPDSGPYSKQILQKLPLGAGFLSIMVFLIFPTTRKGIGYSDTPPHSQ